MPRFTALVVLLALVVVNVEAADLHVHAYSGDEHPEHQHGIAAHHHSARVHAPSNVPVVEARDPGDSVVHLATCSVLATHYTVALQLAGRSDHVDLRVSLHRETRRDIRVHGPPDRTTCQLRAPPA